MSDTPRTDALLVQFGIDTEGKDHDPPFAEFARTLERECEELANLVTDLTVRITFIKGGDIPQTVEAARAALVLKERRLLAENARLVSCLSEERNRAEAAEKKLASFETGYRHLVESMHDKIVGQQAAWIEWRHGKGADAAMQWVENDLDGPGLIPDENEPYGREAQAYYDANQSRPFPQCFCGRPSNIACGGKGWCSEEHRRTDPLIPGAAK